MKKIIKLAGVTVANDNLPRVSSTDDERALASIPDLFFWLQPGAQFENDAGQFRERVNGRLLTPVTTDYPWTHGSFSNGAPSLDAPLDRRSNYSVADGEEFAADRWTVAAVVNLSSAGTVSDELIAYPGTPSTGVINVRLGFDTSRNMVLREGQSSSLRLSLAGTDWIDQACLVMATFSVENGIAFYVNGVRSAEAVADKRPLTDGAFRLGVQGTTGASTNAFSGKLGHVLLLNRDLSAPANAGYRQSLESILMSHYGIS